MEKKPLSISDKIKVLLATLFGVGYTPGCPGTASCVFAVGVFLIIPNVWFYVAFTIISIVISYVVSTRAEEIFAQKDCKKIVIDDFSGQLITFLFVPRSVNFLFVLAGFFLFRMLDMMKVYPANKIEKCGGAKGIVGDDVIAGVYALIILHLAIFIFKILS